MDKIKQHILIFIWVCLNTLSFRAWSVIGKMALTNKKMLKKGKLNKIYKENNLHKEVCAMVFTSALSVTVKCSPSVSIHWWMGCQNMAKSYNKMQRGLMTFIFKQHAWILYKFLLNFTRIPKPLNSIVSKVYTIHTPKIYCTCVFHR